MSSSQNLKYGAVWICYVNKRFVNLPVRGVVWFGLPSLLAVGMGKLLISSRSQPCGTKGITRRPRPNRGGDMKSVQEVEREIAARRDRLSRLSDASLLIDKHRVSYRMVKCERA